MFDALNKPLIH